MDNNQQDPESANYIDNAIRAVQEKKPLPEIDFTLHTMEDGSQVSTLDRVCKGTLATRPPFPPYTSWFHSCNHNTRKSLR